ncbi:Hypothetical predicted protein [Podarcis lilfordi]|uniref:Uncharacterized protein n=1 Tax=Podarcis lilfordi TaxID=74358 RepID=A0AA35KNX2_9SAUR|nr:Hypothetical predicted protein [Podarcis lilfordi]
MKATPYPKTATPCLQRQLQNRWRGPGAPPLRFAEGAAGPLRGCGPLPSLPVTVALVTGPHSSALPVASRGVRGPSHLAGKPSKENPPRFAAAHNAHFCKRHNRLPSPCLHTHIAPCPSVCHGRPARNGKFSGVQTVS